MAGVLFIVCVPRADYERSLKKKEASKINIESTESKINKLRENNIFRRVDNQENIISKCRSSECLSPNRDNDVFENEAKELYKCKSEVTLSAEKKRKGDSGSAKSSWEEVKRAISPKKDKLRITTPEREAAMRCFDRDTPLENILTEVLERLHVKDAVWCPGKESKYYQVFFSLESGALSEEAIQLLGSFGIGSRYNSIVSVIPCALYYHAGAPGRGLSPQALDDESMLQNRHGASAWSRFVSTVRSRTTLAQVVQDVRAEATLTFDWVFLLLVAAFVSAVGLVENSTVFLVGGMLISPLMAPIMACAVGTAVRDTSLQRMGLLHELLGLFLALVIGFIFGLALFAVNMRYNVRDWPTFEMMSRCELRSLWVGVLIALPSGAGVALGMLGDYTASLVGVAISASLLPPAVNAGLFWAMALFHLSFLSDDTHWSNAYGGNFTHEYSNDTATEFFVSGTVSLGLTLVNILCIYVGGVIVYKIKELAPIDPRNMRFWRSTAPTKTVPTPSEETEQLGSGCGSVQSQGQGALDLSAWDYFRWCSISDRMRLARMAAGTKHHDTWSPYTHAPLPHSAPAARDIEAYCRHQTSRIKNVSHLSSAVATYRSTAQGYAPLTSETSLTSVSEDPCAGASNHANITPSTTVDVEQSVSNDGRKMKFKVTPAFDPIVIDKTS